MVGIMIEEVRKRIWLELAELFFLDTEPTGQDFSRVAMLLIEARLTREQVRRELIEIIAPAAGDNLGYHIYPVIGQWSVFDPAVLMPRFERSAMLRATHPRWYFLIQDWLSRRMLQKLGIERLLILLKD
jgi:hypothetical protein